MFHRLTRLEWLYLLPYSVSFIFILLTRGIFWDDWVIFHSAPFVRMSIYSESGRPILGSFFNILFFFDPENNFLASTLTFILFFLSAVLLSRLLKELPFFSDVDRFCIVSIFSVFPVNFNRIAVTILQYNTCYFLFFLGASFFCLYRQRGKNIFRIVSLGLFYISFTMDSLLMFYSIFFLYLTILLWDPHLEVIKNLVKVTFSYMDYILIPFVYFVVKVSFFPPYGSYQNYNKVTMSGLESGVRNLFHGISLSFFHPMSSALSFGLSKIGIILLSSIALYCLASLIIEKKIEKDKIWFSILMILLGLCMLAIGVFPYLVVGKVPDIEDWNSRHQALVPLGAAFFIYFSIKAFLSVFRHFFKGNIRQASLFSVSLALSFFMWFNFFIYMKYQKDWYKQLSIVENMKKSKEILAGRTFLFVDNTSSLNSMNRSYRFYELNGMMKLVFGNELRFGTTDQSMSWLSASNPTKYFQYNMSGYQASPFDYKIFINFGSLALNSKNTFWLVYLQYFNRNKFIKSIKNIVNLESEPM